MRIGGREEQTRSTPTTQTTESEPREKRAAEEGGRVAGSRGERAEPAGRRGERRASPSRPAALTSALSDGLSTAIFCRSASCASGIFPPGPPPSPSSLPAPTAAPFRRRRKPHDERRQQLQQQRRLPERRARRRPRPSNAARPAGWTPARWPEGLPRGCPASPGSRPFLPLLLHAGTTAPPPTGSRAHSQQNSGPPAAPHSAHNMGA